MSVSSLRFTEASGPQDAGEHMWAEDLGQLDMDQDRYEEERTEEARRLRSSARELLERAAGELTRADRERLIDQARWQLQQANDPLPQKRQALERREQITMRSCGRPAVLVRPSLPGHREVYHRDETCGLISGDGRHVTHAGWTPVGEAEAAGYRPCARCGG
ncbi:hypothetical protein GCM10017744_102140 [Streptomyces antimycoticus]|uniref:Uncharacterized protein n=1 Tax=Streptomyces antimycoticus TaxID=68175 RepID=A0A4D4KS17_9ACTN|nr:hypothetical protein SANT12839_101290 [Streptomyces antimycoticus]